jgi:hypothetical protein
MAKLYTNEVWLRKRYLVDKKSPEEVKTMNKMQKIVIGLGIAGAVGLTYVITALKGLPEAFEWEEDEEDE